MTFAAAATISFLGCGTNEIEDSSRKAIVAAICNAEAIELETSEGIRYRMSTKEHKEAGRRLVPDRLRVVPNDKRRYSPGFIWLVNSSSGDRAITCFSHSVIELDDVYYQLDDDPFAEYFEGEKKRGHQF